MSRNHSRLPRLAPAAGLLAAAGAQAAKKPNILVIFNDDIGQSNISAYSMGVLGNSDNVSERTRSPGVNTWTLRLQYV